MSLQTPLSNDKYYWVGTIETFSGMAVDVVNFQSSHISMVDISQSLSLICRYNGHVPSFYSVAEHSVRVAWLLRQEGHSFEVQLAGLLHDAAEAYVGDMIRPLKRVEAIGAVHQDLEHKISSAIFNSVGLDYPYSDAVNEADKAMYYWEVENIRSGKQEGWSWQEAKNMFLARFNYILQDMYGYRPA